MSTVRNWSRSFVLLASILCAAPEAHADPDIYQTVLKSTAWIVNRDRQSSGSGVLVDLSSRLVATNYHVVGKSKEVKVFFSAYGEDNELITDRKTYLDHYEALYEAKIATVGRIVARWKEKDLALVQLDQLPDDPHAVPLAETCCQPGETVHTVGNASNSHALWGYISGQVRNVIQRRFRLTEDILLNAQVVVTTLPSNPGDSGAPIVNDRGELVGIHSHASRAIIEEQVGTTSDAPNRGRRGLPLYRYRPGTRLVSGEIDAGELRNLIDWYYDNIHDPYDRGMRD